MVTDSSQPEAERYDLVILGGSISGSSLALLMRRWCPDLRILVVERLECFGRRIGEATVELSSAFLRDVLKLNDHLAREHLPKHGLRFWFADENAERLHEMSEVGPIHAPDIPSYQLDRSRLDEKVLELAAQEGVEIARPAKLTDVELDPAESRVVYEDKHGSHEVRTRWFVDASGRSAFLARRLGLLERDDRHPVNALWARWKGVLDLDGPELNGTDPLRPLLPRMACSRRQATNHFCGYGWWCWVIPLAGGETSIGLVHDRRHFDFPEGAKAPARESYERFLRSQPGLSQLLAQAEIDGDDFQSYRDLPYRSRRVADHGWAIVGDAAGFIDPYYSPGLDAVSTSVFATAVLLRKHFLQECGQAEFDRLLEKHDHEFSRSFELWFEALYEDKYELFGDAELTAASFLLDTSMYYLGILSSAMYQIETLANPLFGVNNLPARWAHRSMRFYKKRMVKIARRRRARGTYGRRNRDWRCYEGNFGVARRTLTRAHRKGLALWLGAELRELRERFGDLWGSRGGELRQASGPAVATVPSEKHS